MEYNKNYTQIRFARRASGMNQVEFAKSSGVPLRTLQAYEQNKKVLGRMPLEYALKIAVAVGVPFSALFSDDERVKEIAEKYDKM